MLFLKQSTAVTVNIGPFIDDTDGKTAEVGLTEHPADILIAKNGGDFAAKNEASNCTHDNLGWYHCHIDATDTNTLGRLQLHCHEAGFLPVFHEYMVIPANVYDSLVLGSASDYLDVNIVASSDIDFTATQKTSLDTIGDTVITNSTIHTDVSTAISDIATLKGIIDNIHDTDLPDLHTDIATAITYVDTEVGAIKAVTDTLSLATIADAVHDEAVEGAITSREAVKLILAALAGKTSEVVAGTLVIRDANDTADRITATMDANRYRTSVVLNP